MSLRTRLLLTLGLTLALLWGLAATWLMRDLEEQFVATLDQRLAQSARMVAGLMAQLPEEVWLTADRAALSIPPIEGLACQVHSPSGEVMARTHTDLESILAPGERGHSFREEGGVTWRVFTYERGGLTITTADRMDERNQLLSEVFKVAVVPFAVALVGSMVALWLGVVRGLAPLSRLRLSLAKRHPEALGPVATHGVPVELKPLIKTLNGLLERVQQAMVREQRFTNDAAHELRTPLTAIKTHLQVAGRVEGQTARQSLAHAEEGVGRLTRILDQLLMLARVEGQARFDDGECSRIADVVELALRDNGMTLSRFELPAVWPEGRLGLPRELAITALRNLVDNALLHGGEAGPVVLDAERVEGESAVTFRVRDYGPGVEAKLLGQLTERFWRTSKQQGSGLGLAIVNAIAERFGGQLDFTRPEGGGLEARLTLPLQPEP
jgi:two-component system, OmpR family, sensor histidine kinase QseC